MKNIIICFIALLFAGHCIYATEYTIQKVDNNIYENSNKDINSSNTPNAGNASEEKIKPSNFNSTPTTDLVKNLVAL